MINDKDLQLISDHVKNQTEYDLDTVIEELVGKWDDEKYFFDVDEAHKFYKFITKLELDKGVKGQKIKPLRFEFETCTEILCVKSRVNSKRRFREALLDIGRKNGKLCRCKIGQNR